MDNVSVTIIAIVEKYGCLKISIRNMYPLSINFLGHFLFQINYGLSSPCIKVRLKRAGMLNS